MRLDKEFIPFNRPYLTGRELPYIAQAHVNGQLSGDGPFTKRCERWLEEFGSQRALLTHSCTAALEMAAILCDIEPGDEFILPSYTFVSTANAFVLRGAVPVFVDIRADTLNIDETKIEAAITPKTKAIIPVHYAGVACEMDAIMEIAGRHGLYVVEDAAQGCLSTYKGRPLGTIGHLGCLSFHETKNIICGEGGALLVNVKSWVDRAEIIREKGTDRSRYLRGEVDKYTWNDLGSSYVPGEINAAFLWAQMESASEITQERLKLWTTYHDLFQGTDVFFERPRMTSDLAHNAHLYYLINKTESARANILRFLKEYGIGCVSHYVPLHSSPVGRRLGRVSSPLPVTEGISKSLFRLPMWVGLTERQQERISRALLTYVNETSQIFS